MSFIVEMVESTGWVCEYFGEQPEFRDNPDDSTKTQIRLIVRLVIIREGKQVVNITDVLPYVDTAIADSGAGFVVKFSGSDEINIFLSDEWVGQVDGSNVFRLVNHEVVPIEAKGSGMVKEVVECIAQSGWSDLDE